MWAWPNFTRKSDLVLIRDREVLLCHKTKEPISFPYAKELGVGQFAICIFIKLNKLCVPIGHLFILFVCLFTALSSNNRVI